MGTDSKRRDIERGLSLCAGQGSRADLLGAVEEDHGASGRSCSRAGARTCAVADDSSNDRNRVAVKDAGVRLCLNSTNGYLSGGRCLHVETQQADAGLNFGG